MAGWRKFRIAVAVVIGIVGIGVWLVFHRTPSLPPGSHRLVPMNNPYDTVVGWIDDKNLLVQNKTGVFEEDITTGTRTVPLGISRAIAKHPELTRVRRIGKLALGFGDLDWTLSPDGKWVVAYVDITPPRSTVNKMEWMLTKLDGSDIRACPGIESQAWWYPDSLGWIATEQTNSPSGADSSRIIAYGIGSIGVQTQVLVNSSDDLPAGEEVALLTRKDILLFYDENHREGDEVETLKLAPGQTVVSGTYGEPLTSGAYPMSAELSPDKRHILWTNVSPLTMLKAFTKTPKGPNPPWQAGIAITDAQNKNMFVVVPDGAGSFRNPRWMKDSKHISVIHDGALWSVPVL